MSAAKYISRADQLVGFNRNLSRLTGVLNSGKAFATGTQVVGVDVPRDDVTDNVGTIVGAVAGAYMYRSSHPYLGVIGGASIGRNVPALFQPGMRGLATRNLLTTGAGVAGSLYMPKHPILGFIVGALAGGLASHFGGFDK